MKDIGLVGLPGSGKSTLFTALTRAGAAGGRANQAVVPVPDPRLDVLAKLERSAKVVAAQVRFVDPPGGLTTQGLGALRQADALCVVLDAFTGARDPAADLREVEAELLLSDLAITESSLEKAERRAKGKDQEAKDELELLRRVHSTLSGDRPLSTESFTVEEGKSLRGFGYLTQKPLVVVANLDEGAAVPNGLPEGTLGVYASIEAEVAAMDPAEAAALLREFSVDEPGLERVIAACYRALDLITFLTTGEDETRAWEVRRGARAPEAAGAIHSDLERGFIRAEVVGYDDLVAAGSWKDAKGAGTLRVEGKDYQVREGDVLHVLFAV